MLPSRIVTVVVLESENMFTVTLIAVGADSTSAQPLVLNAVAQRGHITGIYGDSSRVKLEAVGVTVEQR